MTQVSNVDELLAKLTTASNQVTIDVKLLSSTGIALFKQMTVKQQSSLITGIISQEADKNAFSFNRTTSNIISENSLSQIDIKTVDKGPILVQLRKDTIGDDIIIDNTIYDLSELEYNITDEQHDYINDTHTVSMSGVSVDYTTPSLSLDVEMNQIAEDRWKDIEALDIIAELFKLELSKYITRVIINDEIQIDMRSLDIDSQLKVCDTLPVKLTRKIMSYIQDIKNLEKSSLEIREGIFIPTDITLFDT